MSNLMAILLQALAARLGIATGRDLAQACRDYYRGRLLVLWVLCEMAIAACDLAEVLGAAIALKLLFGIPLIGRLPDRTRCAVVLYLQQQADSATSKRSSSLLILGIAGAFAVELWLARPDTAASLAGFIPTTQILRDPDMLYIAHRHSRRDRHAPQPLSALVDRADAQVRRTRGQEGSASASRRIDSTVALMSRAVHQRGDSHHGRRDVPPHRIREVADIGDAYCCSSRCSARRWRACCSPWRCSAGQNATLTGTLAGQIVMEGFLNLRLRPWLRRLITRLIAIVPAVIVIAIRGEEDRGRCWCSAR